MSINEVIVTFGKLSTWEQKLGSLGDVKGTTLEDRDLQNFGIVFANMVPMLH